MFYSGIMLDSRGIQNFKAFTAKGASRRHMQVTHPPTFKIARFDKVGSVIIVTYPEGLRMGDLFDALFTATFGAKREKFTMRGAWVA